MKKTLAHHRHCGSGPAIQAVDKDKNPLNREPGSVSGMTFTAKAFTLIELLVVVLIIGILSAIALPQYQKAVMNARFSQLIVYNNALVKAQKVYFLANGTYAEDFDNLDIKLPATPYVSCIPFYPYSEHENSTLCTFNDGRYSISLTEDLQTGEQSCWSYTEKTDPFCSTLTQSSTYRNGCGEEAYCHVFTSN